MRLPALWVSWYAFHACTYLINSTGSLQLRYFGFTALIFMKAKNSTFGLRGIPRRSWKTHPPRVDYPVIHHSMTTSTMRKITLGTRTDIREQPPLSCGYVWESAWKCYNRLHHTGTFIRMACAKIFYTSSLSDEPAGKGIARKPKLEDDPNVMFK